MTVIGFDMNMVLRYFPRELAILTEIVVNIFKLDVLDNSD